MELKDQIVEKVDTATDRLSQHPIGKGLIEGGVSLVPFLGAAIMGTLDARASLLFEKNTMLLTQELQNQVQHLSESKIDSQFLNSDEFTSLLLNILTKNAHTHEEAKTRLFAQILVNSALKDVSSVPYKEGFVRVIGDLSVQHIQAFTVAFQKAQTFTDQHRLDNKDFVTAQEIAEKVGLTQSRTMAYCEELIRYGLLSNWSIDRLEYQPDLYTLTDYGGEFALFIASHLDKE